MKFRFILSPWRGTNRARWTELESVIQRSWRDTRRILRKGGGRGDYTYLKRRCSNPKFLDQQLFFLVKGIDKTILGKFYKPQELLSQEYEFLEKLVGQLCGGRRELWGLVYGVYRFSNTVVETKLDSRRKVLSAQMSKRYGKNAGVCAALRRFFKWHWSPTDRALALQRARLRREAKVFRYKLWNCFIRRNEGQRLAEFELYLMEQLGVRSRWVSGLWDQLHYVHILEKGGNIMVTLVDSEGRVIVKGSSGLLGLRGKKRRSSVYAAKLVGMHVGRAGVSRGCSRTALVVKKRIDGKMRAVLDGLERGGLNIMAIFPRYKMGDDSSRKFKKVRRV